MNGPLMERYIKSYLGVDTAIYRDRCVAFVDILGFKDIITRIESSDYTFFQGLYRILAGIGMEKEFKPSTIEVTCFSDSIVLSSLPESYFSVILQVRALCEVLLYFGILCRGAVVVGPLCHQGNVILGSGLVTAYEQESSVAVYPRIIVPPEFFVDFKNHPYACKIFMKDDDGLYFLNLFYSKPEFVSSIELFGGPITTDMESSWESNYYTKVRSHLETGLLNFRNKTPIFSKYEWLARQFNWAVTYWGLETPPISL